MKQLVFCIFFLLLASTTSLHAEEKVYLHLDNSAYFLGDTLRLSAYVMDTDTKRLTNKSKVLYVELLSPEGYDLDTHIYPLENGHCIGDFYLQPLLLSGVFEIRAYTRYMLNEGRMNYYSKVIPIYEQVKNGQYSLLSMYKRDMKHRKVLTAKIKKESSKSNATNRYFLTQQVKAVYTPSQITPYGLITMKLKGQPHAQFSLSISDANSYVDFSESNIDDLWKANHVQEVKYKPFGRFYQPEQAITVYGKVALKKHKPFQEPKFLGIANCKVEPTLFLTDTLKSLSTVVTDSVGNFVVSLDSLNTDANLLLKYSADTYIHNNQRFFLDERTVLPSRMYTNRELSLQDCANIGGKKVMVRKRKMKPFGNSIYYVDPFDAMNNMIDWKDEEPWLVEKRWIVDVLWEKEQYFKYDSPRTGRAIVVEEGHESDSIPQGRIASWLDDVNKYKKLVVRSDLAICQYYNYSVGRKVGDVSPHFGFSSFGQIFGAGSLHESGIPGGYPDMIFCLIPDDKNRWEEYWKYNNIPNHRYLKITGYTPVLPYHLPNYSVSHPQEDYRRTLYWNPDLQLDENGEATIQFYNNSSCKDFVISGEGISDEGEVIVCK